MKKLIVLAMALVGMNAMADCPQLTGLYSDKATQETLDIAQSIDANNVTSYTLNYFDQNNQPVGSNVIVADGVEQVSTEPIDAGDVVITTYVQKSSCADGALVLEQSGAYTVKADSSSHTFADTSKVTLQSAGAVTNLMVESTSMSDGSQINSGSYSYEKIR